MIALLINRYSANIYSNSIKLNVNNSNNSFEPIESILGEKLSNFNSLNLSDKLFMVTSYPIVHKTINDLGLNVEYFIQGKFKTAESYKFRPITFKVLDFNKKYGQEFTIKLINEFS